jgi:glycosyltransferase involved in cell wall biosynthesis
LDHAFADRVWHWAAKRLGIPGVVLQEGMANVPKLPLLTDADRRAWDRRWSDPRWHWRCVRVLPHPLLRHAAAYTYADYAFVWGEGMRRHLVEAGRSAESTVVTGSPAMDHIVGRRPLAPMERRTVMYVHQPMRVPAELKLGRYEEVLRAVVLGLGCRLLFKLHPGCAYEAPGIRALAVRLGCPGHLVEVVEQGDAVQLLGDASVVVIASSTMGYHAAVAGVPLVVLDYYFDELRFEVGDTGGAVVVRTPEELPGALARAVDDGAFRESLYRGAGRMLEEHLFALDGGSSARVARALRELIEYGAPRGRHGVPFENGDR